jgi:hypothetical protein
MRAVINVTEIEWDTVQDYFDTEEVIAASQLPAAPFSVTVDVVSRDSDVVTDALLEHLSTTYGFLVHNVDYQVAGFTSDVDESSHYS